MADKIVVLNAGHIEQVGSRWSSTSSPKNLFVAGFIGSPKMNLIDGRRGGEARRARPSASGPSISTSRDRAPGQGTVGVAEHLGSDTFLQVDADGARHADTCAPAARSALRHGDTVWLTPAAGKMHRFDADGLATGMRLAGQDRADHRGRARHRPGLRPRPISPKARRWRIADINLGRAEAAAAEHRAGGRCGPAGRDRPGQHRRRRWPRRSTRHGPASTS